MRRRDTSYKKKPVLGINQRAVELLFTRVSGTSVPFAAISRDGCFSLSLIGIQVQFYIFLREVSIGIGRPGN